MINSTLCYIEKEGKILLLHRNKKENDLNEGKYIGVGGKFEEGETSEECLLREVYEETGLRLTEYKFKGLIKFLSDKWENENMYLFHATDFTGKLITGCSEGELVWVEKEKLLDYPTWEGDKYFLKPLLDGKEKINMLVSYEGEKLVCVKDLDLEGEN